MVNPSRIFEELEGDFIAALKACRQRLSGESVHTLRTAARRLETLLQRVKEHDPSEELSAAIEGALGVLKTIRRAAAPVRDLDVQRVLLAETQHAHPGTKGRRLAREAAEVLVSLRKDRRGAVQGLRKVLRGSGYEAVSALTTVGAGLDGGVWGSQLRAVRRRIRESGVRLRMRSRKSLHDYRKRMKFARYLAEMEEGPAAGRIAREVKRVVDAIGRWHDWTLLRSRAKQVLGGQAELFRVLRRERDRSRHRAVGQVKRLPGRL